MILCEISCILHDLEVFAKELCHLRTITIGGNQINLRDLKREFSGENLADEEKMYVEEFWSVVYHPKESFTFSPFRNACELNFFNRMRRILLNINWNVNRVLMRQFVRFLDLLADIQNLHRLLHTPLSDEVADGMQEMIEYLLTVTLRVTKNPTTPIVNCLRFFIQTYRRSRVPFQSAILSILIIYLIKGYVLVVLSNDIMPSMQTYIDFLSTTEGEFQGLCHYENYIFRCVRVPGLSDIFLQRNVLPVLDFVPVNVNRVVMMQQFEELQNEQEENLAEALIYAARAVGTCYRLPEDNGIVEPIQTICRLLSLQNIIRRGN